MSRTTNLWLAISAISCFAAMACLAAPAHLSTYPRTDAQAALSEQNHWKLVAEVKKAQPHIVFIGDSTVAGWTVQGKYAWNKLFAPLNCFNAGIGGETTQSMIWRLDHEALDGISPAIVVLMIGTNNLSVETPEQVFSEISTITQAIRHKLPDAKILLLGVLPRYAPLTPPLLQQRTAIEDKLEAGLKSNHVIVLDVASNLNPHIKANFLPDGVHPSMVGYVQLGIPIEKAIKQIESTKAVPVPSSEKIR